MLKRTNRLRDKKTIGDIFKERPIKGALFTVYKKNIASPPRLAVITSGKNIKLATKRNRLRRRLNEIFREVLSDLPPKIQVLVVAKREAAEASYKNLKSELARAIKQ